jgi:hypothetical protein
MHKCVKCNGSVMQISAKCYDNIQMDSGPMIVGIVRPGVCYDGKTLTVTVCADCGYSQQINVPVHAVPSKAEPICLANKIQEFYDNSLLGRDDVCNKSLSWLSVRISPTDCAALAEAWSQYLSIRHMQTILPEYEQLIESLVSRYKNVMI